PDRGTVVRDAAVCGGVRPVAVTLQEDDTLAFWDAVTGEALRPPLAAPATVRDLAVAVVSGTAMAAVMTWDGDVWTVTCGGRDDWAFQARCSADGARPPAGIDLHPSGRLVVGAGRELWLGEVLRPGLLRRLVSLDSDVRYLAAAG